MAERNEEKQPRKSLGDYAKYTGPRHFSSIARPQITAANFQIEPAMINLVQHNQFAGLDHEDPHAHLCTFIQLCNIVKFHQVPDEAIYLIVFPFSLTGRAKTWLNSFPEHSLNAWDVVVDKFLPRFFPESKAKQAKIEIATFMQDDDEPLCEAWERYQTLLRKCPIHGFDEYTQMDFFLGGLKPQIKLMLDASAGGRIKDRTLKEAEALMGNMASNDYNVQHDRKSISKRGVLDLDSQDALLAQNQLLIQQLDALIMMLDKLPQQLQSLQVAPSSPQQVMNCEVCGGGHPSGQCITRQSSQEKINYMGNQGLQGNYGNHNQSWKPHLIMGQVGHSNRPPPQQHQQQPSFSDRTLNLEETLQQFMHVSISNNKRTKASIHNLEIQIGQLAKKLEEKPVKNFVAD